MRLSLEMSYCLHLRTRSCRVNMINLQKTPGTGRQSVKVEGYRKHRDRGARRRKTSRKKIKQQFESCVIVWCVFTLFLQPSLLVCLKQILISDSYKQLLNDNFRLLMHWWVLVLHTKTQSSQRFAVSTSCWAKTTLQNGLYQSWFVLSFFSMLLQH